jgi:hypothetical protein
MAKVWTEPLDPSRHLDHLNHQGGVPRLECVSHSTRSSRIRQVATNLRAPWDGRECKVTLTLDEVLP